VPAPVLRGAVLVAAGDGLRLADGAAEGAAGGRPVPKALTLLGDRPLVRHAAERLCAAGIAALVVVHHPDHGAAFAQALADLDTDVPITFVPGGATRTDSVRTGTAVLPADVTVVAVHDAARPLTPVAVIRAALDAVPDADSGGRDAVVAAAPASDVADTLKRRTADGRIATVDRSGLVAVQTPQVFRREVLALALVDADPATDDLALVEALLASGRVEGRVVLVEGSPAAHKVTYRRDLDHLERLLAADDTDAQDRGRRPTVPTAGSTA
jgi:2-C-methyl-D-erythritol 4-phosphate cytidylyltransferase